MVKWLFSTNFILCCEGLPQFWYVLWLLLPGKVLCWRSCTGGGAGSNYRPQILIATGLLPQILIARDTKVVPRQHQFLKTIDLLIATFVYDMLLCNIYVGFRVYIKWFFWQQNTVFNLSWKYSIFRIFATTMYIFSHWLSRYTMYLLLKPELILAKLPAQCTVLSFEWLLFLITYFAGWLLVLIKALPNKG